MGGKRGWKERERVEGGWCYDSWEYTRKCVGGRNAGGRRMCGVCVSGRMCGWVVGCRWWGCVGGVCQWWDVGGGDVSGDEWGGGDVSGDEWGGGDEWSGMWVVCVCVSNWDVWVVGMWLATMCRNYM